MATETVQIRADRIKEAIELLNGTLDLKEIVEAFKKQGVSVISDNTPECYGRYVVEDNLLVINKQFTHITRSDEEMAYVLLYIFYYVVKKESDFLVMGERMEADGDVLAERIFELNKKKVPTMFTKDLR